MDDLVNKRITISGTVQGVGYRYWLKELCDANNINGWVLNKKNGEVEAVLINTDAILFKTILQFKVKKVYIFDYHEEKRN